MKKTYSVRAMSAATIVALAWLVPSAQAAAPDDSAAPPSRTVSYVDLDLRNEAGVARLHARIAAAARLVCGGTYLGPLVVAEVQWRRDCREKAIADALSAVQPSLAADHARRVRVAAR